MMNKVIDGVGEDAEVITNANGGKQSKSPMALHLVDPKFLFAYLEGQFGYSLFVDELTEFLLDGDRDHLIRALSDLAETNEKDALVEISKVLQSYQWEFNNPVTRNAIKTKADIICAQAKANGGIQQFLNVMDESNNTPDIIDNGMCVLSTHIEPGRGMGKMIHELTIYRTGGMTAVLKGA